MDGYSPVIFYDFGDYVQTLCGTDTEIYNSIFAPQETVLGRMVTVGLRCDLFLN